MITVQLDGHAGLHTHRLAVWVSGHPVPDLNGYRGELHLENEVLEQLAAYLPILEQLIGTSGFRIVWTGYRPDVPAAALPTGTPMLIGMAKRLFGKGSA